MNGQGYYTILLTYIYLDLPGLLAMGPGYIPGRLFRVNIRHSWYSYWWVVLSKSRNKTEKEKKKKFKRRRVEE